MFEFHPFQSKIKIPRQSIVAPSGSYRQRLYYSLFKAINFKIITNRSLPMSHTYYVCLDKQIIQSNFTQSVNYNSLLSRRHILHIFYISLNFCHLYLKKSDRLAFFLNEKSFNFLRTARYGFRQHSNLPANQSNSCLTS